MCQFKGDAVGSAILIVDIKPAVPFFRQQPFPPPTFVVSTLIHVAPKRLSVDHAVPFFCSGSGLGPLSAVLCHPVGIVTESVFVGLI